MGCYSDINPWLKNGKDGTQFDEYKLQDRNIINISQHGFIEIRAYQTYLISFFGEIINLVDKANCTAT